MDQAIAPDQGLPRAEPDLQPRSFDLIYVGPLRPALGGTQMVCTALLNRLAARGHRIRTITARSPEFGPEIIGRWLHPDIEATSIEMSHIDVLLGYRSEANPSGLERESYFRMQSQRVRTVLGPMISRRRPDLVVIGRESFIHGMPEFLRAQGIPGLLMTHGAAGAVVHGHYRDDLIRPLLESMAEIDGIVAVARHMGEGLEPLGLRHVAVIPNPVNVELFAPRTPDRDLRARLGNTPDDVVVYHASNLTAVKRPLDLIRAVALAMRQNHTIRLIVVGDGPLGAEARIQCGVEGIEDRVRFEGWIDNEAAIWTAGLVSP